MKHKFLIIVLAIFITANAISQGNNFDIKKAVQQAEKILKGSGKIYEKKLFKIFGQYPVPVAENKIPLAEKGYPQFGIYFDDADYVTVMIIDVPKFYGKEITMSSIKKEFKLNKLKLYNSGAHLKSSSDWFNFKLNDLDEANNNIFLCVYFNQVPPLPNYSFYSLPLDTAQINFFKKRVDKEGFVLNSDMKDVLEYSKDFLLKYYIRFYMDEIPQPVQPLERDSIIISLPSFPPVYGR